MSPHRLPTQARILVVRLRRLGDLLLLTPTLRALRNAYPQAQIDLLVLKGFSGTLRGTPHIDRFIELDRGLSAWSSAMRRCMAARYDAVLDFQSSSRSLPFVLATRAPIRVGWRKRGVRDWIYTDHAPGWDEPIYVARNFLRFAARVGVDEASDCRLEIAISDDDRAASAKLLATAGVVRARPIFALSVVSKVDRKRWPAERYALLADRLIEHFGAQLLFTNGPGEIDQVRAVVERMKFSPALWNYDATTLGSLAALYQQCHLWIGNDGGAKHVATAAGCPTLVLIKAGDERFWTDTSDVHQRAVCDPQPQLRDPDSLDGIQPEHVFEAIVRMHQAGGWKSVE